MFDLLIFFGVGRVNKAHALYKTVYTDISRMVRRTNKALTLYGYGKSFHGHYHFLGRVFQYSAASGQKNLISAPHLKSEATA